MTSIGIIGSGPSAIYALKRLVQFDVPLDVTFFEASGNFGFGGPYDPTLNARSMLANIASIELPPVVDTLEDWLRAQDDATLADLAVDRAEISDRAFFSRVAIGAYFAAQVEALRAIARRRGHAATFLSGRRIEDVVADNSGVTFVIQGRDGSPLSARVDYAVIATGHGMKKTRGGDAGLLRPYPAPVLEPSWRRVGVLGSSLSAIDVVVALGLQAGRFDRVGGDLVYEAARSLEIEMMSRGGVIPEADYYFDFPYAPLRNCSSEAFENLSDEGLLDAAFDALKKDLTIEDSGFAGDHGLDTLTADTFAEAYFSPRQTGDAFAYARRNLTEAREGVATKSASGWRTTLLRAHEIFEPLVGRFDKKDKARFDAGLKRVFIDNYAAVPHLSVERLLALNEAGVLSLRRVGNDYALAPAGKAAFLLRDGLDEVRFDAVVDARGQAAMDLEDLPFPTLRMQLLSAAALHGEGELASDVELDFGPWTAGRVYLVAAPFLLDRRPFSQGLTSACAFGIEAAELILARIAGLEDELSAELYDLIFHVRRSEIIEIGGAGVIEAPRK